MHQRMVPEDLITLQYCALCTGVLFGHMCAVMYAVVEGVFALVRLVVAFYMPPKLEHKSLYPVSYTHLTLPTSDLV